MAIMDTREVTCLMYEENEYTNSLTFRITNGSIVIFDGGNTSFSISKYYDPIIKDDKVSQINFTQKEALSSFLKKASSKHIKLNVKTKVDNNNFLLYPPFKSDCEVKSIKNEFKVSVKYAENLDFKTRIFIKKLLNEHLSKMDGDYFLGNKFDEVEFHNKISEFNLAIKMDKQDVKNEKKQVNLVKRKI